MVVVVARVEIDVARVAADRVERSFVKAVLVESYLKMWQNVDFA